MYRRIAGLALSALALVTVAPAHAAEAMNTGSVHTGSVHTGSVDSGSVNSGSLVPTTSASVEMVSWMQCMIETAGQNTLVGCLSPSLGSTG